ncbi:MAG: ABC transporter permease [Acidimicrobiales bacterium]|jgi:putative ABC transport system permease protein|nr:ABC transporter permease [Acidimicrobiales bacterium]
MRSVLDLISVALSGLTSRVSRTLLIMLGPIIGVSAIVAAVGLTESAKGDLQADLAELGTNLITADAAGSFGAQNPSFPEDVVERVSSLSGVESVTGVRALDGIITSPYDAATTYYTAFPTPVLTADPGFLEVMQIELLSGRWLNDFDYENGARVAVIGVDIANEFNYLAGDNRTLLLDGLEFGIVGVYDNVRLADAFNTSVLIPPLAADNEFDTGLETNTLYIRADPERVEEVEDNLPIAINLGGSEEVNTSIPSDALEASAKADSTLQVIVASMGILALIVGGVGIANVMSISVIQRSAEIGIRRALGHGRGLIAWQFLLEAVAVGFFGGLAGVGVGIFIVVFASRIFDWTHVLDPVLVIGSLEFSSHSMGVPTVYLLGMGAALLTSVVAGLYPSVKAARLEPLETLRLG